MPLHRVQAAWASRPWLHYAAVYAIPMAFCLIDKLVSLSAILDMTATTSERDAGRKIGGLALGLVQDALLTTLLVAVLLVLELARHVASSVTHAKATSARTLRVLGLLGHALRAAVVLLSIVAALAFVAADLLLVRTRSIRFTTDLIATYWRERSQASTLEVDPREKQLAVVTVLATAMVSVVFTVLYVAHVDLLWRRRTVETASPGGDAFKPLDTATPGAEAKLTATLSFKCLEEGGQAAVSGSSIVSQRNASLSVDASVLESQKPSTAAEPSMVRRLFHSKKVRLTLVAIIAYALVIAVTRAIATAASPVVAAIALNASLNELLRNVFHVQCLPGSGSDGFESAAYYLHTETESYELFQKDVLFRKTTGFKGPLAFDVQVEEKNPPNVMVLAVESFRYMDSLLMAANTSAGHLMQKNNLTVTPHFDHWASRGIAFNNMWSSWQTSRSLEAILFGQIAYDSVTDSGTTRGRKDTKLVGMPQFFKQKGYETVFTTGCIVTYDQWDSFLPSHGFETVIAAPDMKLIAEKRYNISKRDWDGPAHRGFNWGVHDDLSFDIVGDLMVQKVKEQAERMKRGERKKPFFLNHYTISSHHTFDAHPTWLDSKDLPDFSPLCEGFENECVLIQKYAKLRYFTDMELGKFMDRMKATGVLDDTIVVIVGDHGQSPEMGLANPILYQTAVTHVASALIAEGRLGEAVGMVFEDATHHYDLLNTLADIVGVPKEGFLQTGVGRSLKRKIPFGQRPVWSNNPMKKMAVINGHQRFVYDRSSNDMGLFDTIKDSKEEHDLLPSLPLADATKLQTWRRKGRELNAYFKHRWDEKCLAAVAC